MEDIFRNSHVFRVMQYIDFQKQWIKATLEVLGKSLKTVLDEVHFLVKLYGFPLPQVSYENFPSLR